VHGINGGPYSTWKHQNGTFWLRDLLTKELPGARVYSFGYSAKVFLSLDTGGFEDFARELLEDIRVERGTPAVSALTVPLRLKLCIANGFGKISIRLQSVISFMSCQFQGFDSCSIFFSTLNITWPMFRIPSHSCLPSSLNRTLRE
jgi:hypothetical protein